MWLGFGSVDGIWQRPFLWLVGWISLRFLEKRMNMASNGVVLGWHGCL
jgi:hypothetical protein